MKRFSKYTGSLAVFIKNETLAKFQYRGALWADLIFFILGYGTQFLLIYLLVGKFGTLGGWNRYEGHAALFYVDSFLYAGLYFSARS